MYYHFNVVVVVAVVAVVAVVGVVVVVGINFHLLIFLWCFQRTLSLLFVILCAASPDLTLFLWHSFARSNQRPSGFWLVWPSSWTSATTSANVTSLSLVRCNDAAVWFTLIYMICVVYACGLKADLSFYTFNGVVGWVGDMKVSCTRTHGVCWGTDVIHEIDSWTCYAWCLAGSCAHFSWGRLGVCERGGCFSLQTCAGWSTAYLHTACIQFLTLLFRVHAWKQWVSVFSVNCGQLW